IHGVETLLNGCHHVRDRVALLEDDQGRIFGKTRLDPLKQNLEATDQRCTRCVAAVGAHDVPHLEVSVEARAVPDAAPIAAPSALVSSSGMRPEEVCCCG